MGLRQLKKDKTRAQFLEAALKLFSEQGFEATTINQIADLVGVSPRTLLRYFQSKEDIIVSWLEESMSNFLENFKKHSTKEPFESALVLSARDLLDLYSQKKDFYLGIEYAIAGSSQISSRKNQLTALLVDEVTEISKNQQAFTERGDFVCVSLFPQVLFTIIRVVITKWVKLDGNADLQILFNKALAALSFKEFTT